jgi:dipeptidyl aminopeptidase/acylaminoacyl peptidase
MGWKDCIAFILAGLLYSCGFVQTIPVNDLEASPTGKVVKFFYPTQLGEAEGYLIRPKGVGPFPLVVLLHGHSWKGEGATKVIPAAEQISNELCYASLAVSLPGYGTTKVKMSYGIRETTAKVVLDGILRVRGLSWVDSKHIMLYGFSRGAVFAAELASQIPELVGVVLHSGAYDIGRLYNDTPSNWLRLSINPNGEANPPSFSVLPEVANWTAPTLILHGGSDQIVPASQAYLLHDRLASLGKPHRLVLFRDAGHLLPLDGVKKEVLSFLTQNVGSACKRK